MAIRNTKPSRQLGKRAVFVVEIHGLTHRELRPSRGPLMRRDRRVDTSREQDRPANTAVEGLHQSQRENARSLGSITSIQRGLEKRQRGADHRAPSD
jgi:hypothetical protein